MKNWLKYLLLITGAIICLGYAGFMFIKGKSLENEKICRGVIINIYDSKNNLLITEKDITDFLDEEKIIPTGKFYRKFKTKKIEESLEKHPLVRNAECYKTPNGKLEINIEQRTPILQIIGMENYYVDDLRKVIPVSTKYTAYVPIASGNISNSLATGKLFDFAQYIEKDSFWIHQIEQIYINDSAKVMLVPRVGDHTIILGNFDRFEKKLEKLKKLYLYGLNKTGWNQYKTIDVQYKDQVVCTRR